MQVRKQQKIRVRVRVRVRGLGLGLALGLGLELDVEATEWFQIGKGVRQGCILYSCLFNLYVEYIMRNTGLEEAQAGIKIAERNINNLRYADDTTLMAQSEN